jgi:PAS domain S-box-containing protein
MSADLLARHTLEGTCLYVSPACLTLLGYEPEELIGRSWNDFLCPEDIPAVAQTLAEVLDTPADGSAAVHTVTYRIRHKNGGYVWFETLARIAACSNGAPLEIYTSSRDVTGQKEAESEREKLICKLQDFIKDADPLSGVIAICSHCKKIRDDSGRWEQLEAYFHKHSKSLFSHGICPECARETFREFTEELGLDLNPNA